MIQFKKPLCGALMLFPLVASSANNIKEKNPNIILIITDQQRFDALGSVNPSVISPNLDKLALDGNLFSNAYSSTPSSTPARAGLITGMSPWNHGMLGYGVQAEKYEFTMPQLLSDAGYNTMGLGKMHFHPQRNTQGFDMLIIDESGRVQDNYFISDYRQWFNNVAYGLNPDETNIGWNSHKAGVYKLDEELHPTQWTGDVAVNAINGYNSDKPLFLKVSFARPHSPYDPPKRVLDMYDNMDIPVPSVGEWVCEEWRSQSDTTANLDAAIGAFGDEYAKRSRRHYYASITFVDEQVGRIVDALKDRDMYEDTFIIFLSDHGDMLGDHNLWRKTYAYEGSAAIPFIVKLPANRKSLYTKGEEIEYPVEIRDILPTMLELCNIDQPEIMDGCSLIPLLEESNPKWREYIDLEHSRAYWDTNYWMSLTDGKIKYIWFRATGEEQLFDLERDPYEVKDLSTNTKYKKQLNELRDRLTQHLSVRGKDWVENGVLKVTSKSIVYGDNFPKEQ